VELGDLRRERIGLPLLRDERPELHLRELRRILAERTGMGLDEASEPPAGAGAAEARDDVAEPGRPPSLGRGTEPR
jgi:hypothetical protein